MLGQVPAEVSRIIAGEVGKGLNRIGPSGPLGTNGTLASVRENLQSCALVQKCWTPFFREILFREVVVYSNDELPPEDVLGFVKMLDLYVVPQDPHEGEPTRRLFEYFSKCPRVRFLRITGAAFSRLPELKTNLKTLSDHWQAWSFRPVMIFRSCRFDPAPLYDILSVPDVDTMFLGCCETHPQDPATNWDSVYHDAGEELCVMGNAGTQIESQFLIYLSGLSVGFPRLDLDYFEDILPPCNVQPLIDASADVLRVVKLNMVSSSPFQWSGSMLLPPLRLSSCIHLSEFVLNMNGSETSVLKTSLAILAELKANLPNLPKFTVVVGPKSRSLFASTPSAEDQESWYSLDYSLVEIAEAQMNGSGEKFTFAMNIACEDDTTIERARVWVPFFLLWFNQKGSLRINPVSEGGSNGMGDAAVCRSEAVLKACR